MTNLGDETILKIITRAENIYASVAFDSAGVARAVTETRFGSAKGDLLFGVEARLMPNVETPLLIFFEDTTAPEFATIRLGAGFPQPNGARVSKPIVFRHVPISR